jgi:BirA family biotin operon repressor/biotin-[acetyl-CoA-carboxylase] ligase
LTGRAIDGLSHWRHLDVLSVSSTNAEAMALAEAGDPGNLWITAGEQIEGRGRRGRDWASPPGNLYASALLVDLTLLERLHTLPLVAAVGVHGAIAATGLPEGAELTIKWPNDILLNGAKCCGMLMESRTLADGRVAVVIGCGINIASHPEPGLYKATALNREGIDATPGTLFAHLARAMDAAISLWDGGHNVAAIRAQWLDHAQGIGQSITVNLASGRLEGIFDGIDTDGALMLRDDQGRIHPISAGDLFFDTHTIGANTAPGNQQEQNDNG